MADFDASLPVRTTANEEIQVKAKSGTKLPIETASNGDVKVQVLDAAGTSVINPAKEDGNLATLAGAVTSGRVQVDIVGDGGININEIGGSGLTLGQKAMAASVPVVLASDQAAIPVSFSTGATDQAAYSTAAAIATNASSNQSFTPGAAVRVKKIQVSASGQLKAEVKWGATGSEVTKAVGFTSKGSLVYELDFPDGLALTTSDTLIIVRTNLDNQAQDVYSTVVYQ